MIARFRNQWQPFLMAGLSSLLLAGCDSSNVDTDFRGCTDAFGPAGPVDVTLPSFNVGDGEDADDLEVRRTLFRQYFRAIQPNENGNEEGGTDEDGQVRLDNEDAQRLADTVGDVHSAKFVQFEGDYSNYSSVRNPFDLIESLDTGGQVNAFSEGRNAMRNCVEEDQQADFNIDDVRLTERLPEDADEDEEEPRFDLRVNYSHRPFPGGDRDNAEVEREVRTPGFSQQVRYFYDPGSYSTTGFNNPKRIFADLLAEDEESNLIFISERGSDNTDIWLWSLTQEDEDNPPEKRSIELNDESRDYRCLFVRIRYDRREVDGLLSEDVCSVTTLTGDSEDLDGSFEFIYSSEDNIPQSPE